MLNDPLYTVGIAPRLYRQSDADLTHGDSARSHWSIRDLTRPPIKRQVNGQAKALV